MNASRVFLFLSWLTISYGVWTFRPVTRLPKLSQILITALIMVILGVLFFWLAGKMGEKYITPNAPNFKITLLGGNVFVPDQDPSLTGLALEARIRNAGAPSIATDWKLIVTVHKEKPITAQLTKPPDHLTLSGKAGKIVLSESDFSLEYLAVNKALKTGDSPIGGFILFYIHIPRSKVIAPDTILELFVSDYSGRTFSEKQKMGDWLQR
jgi:hypothetical protein